MTAIVSIKQASDKVSCDSNGNGNCKFFVTNAYTDRQLLLKARVVTGSGTDEKWISSIQAGANAKPTGGAISNEWKLAPSATEEISVNFQVPKSVADGKYPFHLQVFSVDRPDDDFKDGEPVYLQIQNAVAPPPPPKPFPWWILVLALVVLLTIGVAVWLMMKPDDTGPVVEKAKVPDLKGMIWDEAQQRLKQAGLSKFETSFKFDPSKRDPIVLDQSPSAGSAAEAETTVSVVLSFPGIAVPDLRGKTLLAAAQTLSNSNLVLGEANSQPTNAQPEQTVIEQNPAPGQAVDKGTPIKLTVATTPTRPVIIWDRDLTKLMTRQQQIFKVMPRGIEPAEQ
ncbi:PASTA domain-containing protein [Methylomonas koyamae]|uniref:PASTA domain-containing protein n=1 Tax=Methylomonas koyamae TaxID=702114 RepID=UPI0011272307|nr:PASTA domain-containing protein [Methylomonas koyamae]TPQ27868.1 hypothetical protein C2U68_06340 [Methylomonas koyamae]